jgi:hypothetical protein
MQRASGLTPELVIEELSLYAGPAVWGYRDAVMAAASALGVSTDHDSGLVQIGLHLAGRPDWLVGWRIDHGWYLVCRRIGEPSAIGPTVYRADSDPLDQLLPEPAAVAGWLHGLSTQRLRGTERHPDVALSAPQLATLRRRLRGYLPTEPTLQPGYSWSEDRPTKRVASQLAAG